MTHASLRRKLAFLLLLAFFAVPWVTVAGERPGAQPQFAAVVPFDFAGRLWRLLARVWGEEGCRLDPDGQCLPETGNAPTATTRGDEGCRLDPNGRCAS